jgi:hypothetical protein
MKEKNQISGYCRIRIETCEYYKSNLMQNNVIIFYLN